MIADERQLMTTLHYLTSLSEMLNALYLTAKERHDFTLFAVTAEGYFSEISRLNAEIRQYLEARPDTTEWILPKPATIREEAA